jgi:methylthioribose-1-phosphate isomerase
MVSLKKGISPIIWDGNHLYILDQRKLPHEEKFIKVKRVDELIKCIKTMAIRGAPAIGIAGAYGLLLWAKGFKGKKGEFLKNFRAIASKIKVARPTAVNLSWAVERMVKTIDSSMDIEEMKKRLEEEAKKIHEEDISANRKIGEYGEKLIKDGWTVLTHCNAGALATGGYGTALGVIRTCIERGKKIKVVACETRPLLQGARLTAWELKRDGIDVTVITDSSAGFLMRKGLINAVIVGADRIAMNGDFANKIGTYSLAVLSSENKIPFYVAAPSSTFDPNLKDGSGIPIEERDEREVKFINGKRMVPAGVKAINFAFDITPFQYVTAFITEKGIIRKPFKSIRKIIGC